MRQRLNPEWCAQMEGRIFRGEKIDCTENFNLAIQWLVIKLSTAGIPFKLYNLGAGVKRVTTDTTTCPCCKRAL